jgi:hypothetical protein
LLAIVYLFLLALIELALIKVLSISKVPMGTVDF